MARTGRPRKPDHDTTMLAPGLPLCPDTLPEVGRELWSIVVRRLPENVLSELDQPALEGVCRWFAKYRELALADNDLRAETTAWKHFFEAAKSFGLTPADRSRLKAQPDKKLDDEPSILKVANLG